MLKTQTLKSSTGSEGLCSGGNAAATMVSGIERI